MQIKFVQIRDPDLGFRSCRLCEQLPLGLQVLQASMVAQYFIGTFIFQNFLSSFNNFLLIIREYFVKAQYTGNEQLFGKTAIVTGANTGIGKEVAHDLARRGRKNI